MRDFRELKVWQKAHKLTLALYRATAVFPREEMYGMVSQIRRAAVSIEANIAEGSGKNSRPEFGRYLEVAKGSASEVECHLLIARDLGFLSHAEYQTRLGQVTEIKKMLTGFVQYLTNKKSKVGFPEG